MNKCCFGFVAPWNEGGGSLYRSRFEAGRESLLCGLFQPLRRGSEVHAVALAVMINLGCVCIWDWHTDGWCILMYPVLPAAFWGKCRDMLQSRSSMARDSLSPSSSQPAGCGRKRHLQSQEDSPSTSSRAPGWWSKSVRCCRRLQPGHLVLARSSRGGDGFSSPGGGRCAFSLSLFTQRWV